MFDRDAWRAHSQTRNAIWAFTGTLDQLRKLTGLIQLYICFNKLSGMSLFVAIATVFVVLACRC
jgi:hypothetical protein